MDGDVQVARKPSWEIRRKWYEHSSLAGGRVHKGWRTYGHGYWRPFTVVLLGRVLIGKRHLRRTS